MGKTGQATVSQSFDMPAEGGSTEFEEDPLLSTKTVNRALDPGLRADLRAEDGASSNQPESFGDSTWNNRVAAPVLSLPPSPVSRMATFRALQEWEGYVVEIEDDAFVARLVDLTAGMSQESEEATIPLDEISDRDAANMEIGSIFRWVIGYERSPEGTRKRVSQIVFRDLPRMTDGDLHAGREWARKMVSAFNP